MTTDMRERFYALVPDILAAEPRAAVVLADIGASAIDAGPHAERVINVGIREQLAVSVAGGLALTGMRPVLHTFASFLLDRPYEQVKLDLNHQDVGAVLVSAGGSYDFPLAGRTHQSPADVALLDTLPGWTVHVPGHPDEARAQLMAALPGDDRVYLRLSKVHNAHPHPVDGVTVIRAGGNGVVLAVGPMLDRVLAATEGMDVAVAYTATVRPFDAAGLRAAVDTARPDVVLVEPYLAGTSSHEVSAALSDRPHRLHALGVRRDAELRAYGTRSDHDHWHGLTPEAIATSVRAFVH